MTPTPSTPDPHGTRAQGRASTRARRYGPALLIGLLACALVAVSLSPSAKLIALTLGILGALIVFASPAISATAFVASAVIATLVTVALLYRSESPSPQAPQSASPSDPTEDAPRDDGGARPPTAPGATPPPPAPRPRLSREQHDKLARQIRARLRAARPEADAEPDAPPQAPGSMDPAVIQDIISEEFIRPARECYNQVLRDDPDFQGKVALRFTILGDPDLGGVVDEVTLADDTEVDAIPFTDCLREAMYEIRFDSPEGGGIVDVTYPFNFAPG